MEVADVVIKPIRDFMKDSIRFAKKCSKPDRQEFAKIAATTGFG
jgi:protein transport protein SEC61 subunit gamma and related proteins